MQHKFVKQTLNELLARNIIKRDHSILALCADERDASLFSVLGFSDVTLTNLTRVEEREGGSKTFGYDWYQEDAQSLSFTDDSFDIAFVSAGLHHCQFPHRALAEMYRVSRKAVIVYESRDSSLMRLSKLLKLSGEYEINKTLASTELIGGMNGGSIPNYVYRWTEREFEKTVCALDPIGKQKFMYFYDFSINKRLGKKIGAILKPVVWLITRVAKKQGNCFGMVAIHPALPDDMWPWIEKKGNEFKVSSEYINKMKKFPDD